MGTWETSEGLNCGWGSRSESGQMKVGIDPWKALSQLLQKNLRGWVRLGLPMPQLSGVYSCLSLNFIIQINSLKKYLQGIQGRPCRAGQWIRSQSLHLIGIDYWWISVQILIPTRGAMGVPHPHPHPPANKQWSGHLQGVLEFNLILTLSTWRELRSHW